MRRKHALSIAVIASGLMVGATLPASAQFYGSDAYYAPRASSNAGYDEDMGQTMPGAWVSGPVRRLPPNLYRDPRYADQDAYDDVEPAPLVGSRGGTRMASLPPDADPAYSGHTNYDLQVDQSDGTRRLVQDPTGHPAGTITVNTETRKLYLSLGGGQAIEYGIGVGREGFLWKGSASVGRKAVWPGWTPPADMLKRRPDLPRHMAGGMDNPLGARALYLFKGNKDTMFRIHGTNEPDTIGQAVSSGCIRMMNADVMDLYQRVVKGARVVVI